MSRQIFPTVLAFTLLALAATTLPASAEEVRRINWTIYPDDATMVHADLTLGGLSIEGHDGRDIEVEVQIECVRGEIQKCRARAKEILLQPRRKGDVLQIFLKYTPRAEIRGLKANMWLRVPRNLMLNANARAGGVRVEGMVSHVEIGTVVGDVELTYPFRRTKSVNVDVGIGKALLLLPEGRGRVEGTGFPRTIDWIGDGPAQVEVDIGTGDATVRLE